MGINYWDTSSSYGNGKNEEVIGQFYGKYPEDRKKVFQVTKASRTTAPEKMTEQLNLSLERMQTDYIDLYFIHMLQDPALLTAEVKAWAEQKKKGKKDTLFRVQLPRQYGAHACARVNPRLDRCRNGIL
jgi:aryl-alcohol dehydrogenase-like predicted oxidoreductase